MKKKYVLLIVFSLIIISFYYPFPPITSVEGLKDNYKTNEIMDFTLKIYGCGKDCGSWHIDFLVKETDQILANWHYANGDSPIPRLLNSHSFSSTYRMYSNPPTIETPGQYTIIVLLDQEPIFEKRIVVTKGNG